MLSDIVRFEEDRILGEICTFVGKSTLCLTYDGAIFECASSEEVSGIHVRCAALMAEFGISEEIKQRGQLEYAGAVFPIPGIWTSFINTGKAQMVHPVTQRLGSMMCLYNAVRFLSVSE